MEEGELASSLLNFSLGVWEVTPGEAEEAEMTNQTLFYYRTQADSTWQAACGQHQAAACVPAILGLKKKMPLGPLRPPLPGPSACCQTLSPDKCRFGKWCCVVVSARSLAALDCSVKCVEV